MDQAIYDHPDVYDRLYGEKDYEGEVDFVVERFADLGNGGDRALIIGCGTGRHSPYLIDHGFQVTGLDPNPAMLETASTRCDATYVEGGLPDVDVEGSFDLIWAPYTVMNYLEPAEFTSALQAMDRSLANGGIIVFDIGDFPQMSSPAIQLAGDQDPVARIFWYRRPGNTNVLMEAVIFHDDDWFIDRHSLTSYPVGVVAHYLRELHFSVDIHDWYETRTSMPNPAVFVAYDEA